MAAAAGTVGSCIGIGMGMGIGVGAAKAALKVRRRDGRGAGAGDSSTVARRTCCVEGAADAEEEAVANAEEAEEAGATTPEKDGAGDCSAASMEVLGSEATRLGVGARRAVREKREEKV